MDVTVERGRSSCRGARKGGGGSNVLLAGTFAGVQLLHCVAEPALWVSCDWAVGDNFLAAMLALPCLSLCPAIRRTHTHTHAHATLPYYPFPHTPLNPLALNRPSAA